MLLIACFMGISEMYCERRAETLRKRRRCPTTMASIYPMGNKVPFLE